MKVLSVLYKPFPYTHVKLIKNCIRLVAETPVEEVVPYLQEKRILSVKQAEDFLYQNTEKNKVRQLIITLVRRGT